MNSKRSKTNRRHIKNYPFVSNPHLDICFVSMFVSIGLENVENVAQDIDFFF